MARNNTAINPLDAYIIKNKAALIAELDSISDLMANLKIRINNIRSNTNVSNITNLVKKIHTATETFLEKHINPRNKAIDNSTIQSFKNIIGALRDIELNYNPTSNRSVGAIQAHFKNLSENLSDNLIIFRDYNPNTAHVPAPVASTPPQSPTQIQPSPASAAAPPLPQERESIIKYIKLGENIYKIIPVNKNIKKDSVTVKKLVRTKPQHWEPEEELTSEEIRGYTEIICSQTGGKRTTRCRIVKRRKHRTVRRKSGK